MSSEPLIFFHLYIQLDSLTYMSFHKFDHRWMVGIVIIMLLSACSSISQTHLLRKIAPNIPPLNEITSVPFYPQRDYQCGPAALATIINFYKPQTTVEELIPLVYIPKLKGSLQVEMIAASRRFNRLTIQLDGKLESILKEVARGNPVLVMQNLGFETIPFWHYAVVVGYDLEKQDIILRSGEIKRYIRPFSVFERTWKRSDFWSVVMVPPGLMPVTATEDNYTKAAINFETSSAAKSSVQAYQTGIDRWPNNFILQMGLGNSAFATKDFTLAERAFLRATTLQPGTAEAWNNLSYALLLQGKQNEALDVINQALQLAPDNKDFISSKQDILNYR